MHKIANKLFNWHIIALLHLVFQYWALNTSLIPNSKHFQKNLSTTCLIHPTTIRNTINEHSVGQKRAC